ncbi:FAD-binding protein [Aureimonas ureilytica]|uniref:FAD-binding protein n=1 Tax=Aureimonas ureilytica TaxID=401562 RepID=UPI0009E9AC62|nr:FAD-binding protein [Aureimonas ureilytica]
MRLEEDSRQIWRDNLRLNRRELVRSAAATALLGPTAAIAAKPVTKIPHKIPSVFGISDNRFDDLRRGANARWLGNDQSRITVPLSNSDAKDAVSFAVDRGLRLAARSGGHCYESFATEGIELSVNMREFKSVGFDQEFGAISVGAGCTLGETYGALFRRWGVTVPGGTCPTVGLGGHVPGGGYGALSRMHGLIIDHLAGAEILLVDRDSNIRQTVALRRDHGSSRDLWWALTGGGAGQIGLITRFLFATSDGQRTPADILPRAPENVIQSSVRWNWDDLSSSAFKRVVRAYGDWLEAHSGNSPSARSLFSQLRLQPRTAGSFEMMTQIDPDVPGAESSLAAFEQHVIQDTTAVRSARKLPWLMATIDTIAFSISDTTRRFKGKSAYLRKGFTDEQLDTLYEQLGSSNIKNPAFVAMLTSYGGKINEIHPTETATWQRNSIIKINFIVFWDNASEDNEHISNMRKLYSSLFSTSGGVPVHNEAAEGCYIGYADEDLQSKEWNKSGFTYKDLYWGGNARVLTELRTRYDPHNIFMHAQVS